MPHTGYIPVETMTSILKMQNFNNQFANLKISFHFIANALIYDARESAVQYALENKINWILFIDSDMEVPEDIIAKLIKHQKAIVAALAFKRVPDYDPCIYINTSDENEFPKYVPIDEWEENTLLSVDAVGHGCVLINMEIFNFIEPPYYFPILSEDHTNSLGEDLAFCYKLKKANIPIFVDTSIQCGHIGKYTYNNQNFIDYKNTKKE